MPQFPCRTVSGNPFDGFPVSDISRKEQVLEWICQNPFISQQELASRCGLSRSAVAGHIASLIREGRLLGRAYLLPAQAARNILCIGGANLDRKLRVLGAFQMATSNPVAQAESHGGVARNIAENLARLGCQTALLSAFGDDAAGLAMRNQLQGLGVDLDPSLVLQGQTSDSYSAVLDANGDMLLALAHMELVDALTPACLQERIGARQRAGMLCADMNLSAQSLTWLLQLGQQGTPLALIAVSQPKMARLPQDLRGLSLLILNLGELASLLGRDALDEHEVEAAFAAVHARGVAQLVLTRGAQGVLCSQGDGVQQLRAPALPQVVDVTGAGDAFAAAVCATLLHSPQNLAQACRNGVAAAAVTLQSARTVSLDIGPHLLQLASCDDALN